MNDDAQIDDFGTLVEPTTLVIQRWLPGPVDRVWKYLADSKFRQKWLAAGDMDLAPGAPVELVWRNDRLSAPSDPRPEGFSKEERMQSQVIAVDPMRLLTIAWGQGDVTFELKEKGDRVLLTLTHRGLDDHGTRTKVAAGWHMHLDVLRAEASGTKAESFWSGWVKRRDEYEVRLQQ